LVKNDVRQSLLNETGIKLVNEASGIPAQMHQEERAHPFNLSL